MTMFDRHEVSKDTWLILSRLDRVEGLLLSVLNRERIIMSLTEDAAAAIAKMDTAVGSMLAYLKTFPPTTTVTDLIAAMNKDADQLNAVLPANVVPPPAA